MDTIYYYLFGGAIVVFVALALYLRAKGKKELLEEQRQLALQQQALQQQQATAPPPQRKATVSSNPEMLRLQLQAYERITILCERIGLNNLLGRLPVNQISAAENQNLMVQSIKTEF